MLKLGDFCWFDSSCWVYLGMDEDGCIHFVRPRKGCPFGSIEFAHIWPAEDPDAYDRFMHDNGESFTERCKRKGIEVPE